MRYVCAALATILLVGGCSSAESDAPAAAAPPDTVATTTTTTTAPTTTTTTTAPTTTTTTADACAEALEIVIGSFEAVFDRIDVDPEGAIDKMTEDNTLNDLFTELGGTMGSSCGGEAAGPAVSDLITYLAREATERNVFTAAFIGGVLGEMCQPSDSWTLTPEARAACATT